MMTLLLEGPVRVRAFGTSRHEVVVLVATQVTGSAEVNR
jgi:hypothetical protein